MYLKCKHFGEKECAARNQVKTGKLAEYQKNTIYLFNQNLNISFQFKRHLEEKRECGRSREMEKQVEYKYIWYVYTCACTHTFKVYYFETPEI